MIELIFVLLITIWAMTNLLLLVHKWGNSYQMYNDFDKGIKDLRVKHIFFVILLPALFLYALGSYVHHQWLIGYRINQFLNKPVKFLNKPLKRRKQK